LRPSPRPLSEDFAPPARDQWLSLVEKSLKGAPLDRLTSTTYDGLSIRPLYTADDADPVPGARRAPAADPTRPWDVRSLVEHPDPAQANADVRRDLGKGAASVLLSLDPSGRTGVAVASQDHLARVLDGVLLDLAPVALDAGFMGPAAADWLAVLAKGAPAAPLAFHLDPLSAFAEAGIAPGPVEAHLIAAANTAARHAPAYPKASLFLATGRVVHEAGGADAQELGFACAAAVAYARAMVRAGLPMAEAWNRLTLGVSIDAEYFASLAKLRAARALFSRLASACGVQASARVEARSSRRMLAAYDPWTNLLRLTAAGFAAAAGGADAVVLDPFTRPLGRPTAFARRQARNIQLVLMEEAHLGRVADPAGGAWFVERQTEDLARAAWAFFQDVERAGGALAGLESGLVAERVAAVREARLKDVARRKAGLIGVSEFPNLDEAAVAVDPVDPAAFAVAAPDLLLPGPQARCPALAPVRLSEPFERLRARAEAVPARPEVYLATIGDQADFSARLGFSRNLFAAGGIGARVGAPDAFDPAETALAVICSSDERYAESAAAVAATLRARGARAVWLAGRPGELESALRAAGIDGFVYAGCDAVKVLTDALAVSGVPASSTMASEIQQDG